MAKKEGTSAPVYTTDLQIHRVYLTRETTKPRAGGAEDKGVCPPMLICPQRAMAGRRKSSGGCRDVFECA